MDTGNLKGTTRTLDFRQPADWTAMFVEIDPTPALITQDQNLPFAALSGYPWPPMQMSGGVELNPAVLESYLERFYRNAQRRDFIVGSAFPGFHDIYDEAGVRSSYGYLDARDGQTLRNTLDLALAANPNIVRLVTWNDYGEGTTIEPTEEFGYQYLEVIQTARQGMDTGFTISTDDLRLPMSLLQARRNHTEDAEANARLDQAFVAIVSGDLATAREILDAYSLVICPFDIPIPFSTSVDLGHPDKGQSHSGHLHHAFSWLRLLADGCSTRSFARNSEGDQAAGWEQDVPRIDDMNCFGISA